MSDLLPQEELATIEAQCNAAVLPSYLGFEVPSLVRHIRALEARIKELEAVDAVDVTDYDPLDELRALIRNDGYVRGNIMPVDAQVAADHPCPQCDGPMFGEGWRSERGGYRAIAYCPACSIGCEF